jgi:hypothetical protein
MPMCAWGLALRSACMIGNWGVARLSAVGCWRAVVGSVSGAFQTPVCDWAGFCANSAQRDGKIRPLGA